MEVTVHDEALWERAKRFLRDCEGKRAHIIHDYDVDGISGGLVLLHALDRLGATATASTRQGRGHGMAKEELLRIRTEHDPERIIITDQDLKSFEHYESFREVFPGVPTLIIDHHFLQEYDDVVFIHPKLVYGVNGSVYPSAKLVHDLCAAVVDADDLAWLACCGILGDAGTPHHRDFLEGVAEREGFALPDDPYTSRFSVVSEAVECCSCASEDELLAYVDELKGAPTMDEAIAIGNPCQHIRDELDTYLARGLTLGETHGAVTFIPIESEYGIAGWVTTLISFRHPERILIGYRDQTDGIHLSGRHQAKRVHLGEIFRELCTELGGRGGGHAPAAGGRVPKGNWDEFKRRVVEAVERDL